MKIRTISTFLLAVAAVISGANTANATVLPATNMTISSGLAATNGMLLGSGADRANDVANNGGTSSFVSTNGSAPVADLGLSLWARAGYFHMQADGDITGSADRGSYDQNSGFFQAGINSLFINDADGQAIASLYGHVGTSSADMTRAGAATGTFDASSIGAGIALTWIDTAGWYADLNNQITAHSIDTTSIAATSTGTTDGTTFAVSLETGWNFQAMPGLAVIPQAQLAYQHINIDSFTDSVATVHSFADNDSLEGRFGVKLETDGLGNGVRANVAADIVHEFLDGGTAAADGTPLGFDMQGTAGKIAGGFSFQPTGSDLKIWSEASYRTPFGDGRETLGISAGLRLNF